MKGTVAKQILPNADYIKTGGFGYLKGVECIPVPTSHLDFVWRAGRALQLLASLSGGGATVLLWFGTLCALPPRTWRFLGLTLLLSTLLRVCGFSWFLTEACKGGACQASSGAWTDMLSAVLWLIGGAIVLRRREEEEIKVEEMNALGGGMVVTGSERVLQIPDVGEDTYDSEMSNSRDGVGALELS